MKNKKIKHIFQWSQNQFRSNTQIQKQKIINHRKSLNKSFTFQSKTVIELKPQIKLEYRNYNALD